MISFLILIFYIIVAIILDGWVITQLWLWFVVPTFKITPLSIPIAIGIHWLVFFLCPKKSDLREESIKSNVDLFLESVFISMTALFGGFVAKQFI